MIKKGKKRISITLDEDTLDALEDWLWLKPSWSYWVNRSLQIMVGIYNRNGIIPETLSHKKLKDIKVEFIMEDINES